MTASVVGNGLVVEHGARAQGAAQSVNFSVPAGSLSKALTAFGQQSGLQVTFLASVASGKTSPGYNGQGSREQALGAILQGTGLTYSFPNATTVAISSTDGNSGAATLPGAIALDTIDVSGGGSAADAPYQTPGSVSYISEESIQRFRGDSAGDMLKGTPGVVSGMNRNGAAVDVNIRGLQGMNRVATTVDGSDASTSTWRGYQGVDNRTYVDPDLISGVTVTKGPNDGSPGAIGGTVAMETLNAADILAPGETRGVRLKGSIAGNSISPIIGTTIERTDRDSLFGTGNTSASAAAAARSENVDIVAAIAHRRSGNYFAGTNGSLTYTDYLGAEKELSSTKYGEEVFNTSEDVTSYLLKSTLRLSEGQELKLGYSRYENAFGEVTPLIVAVNSNHLERQVPLSDIAVDRMTARYSWKPADNDLIDFKLNSWMTNTNEDAVYSVYIDSFYHFLQTKNYGIEGSNTSRFDLGAMPFTLRYGGSYALEDAASRKPTESALGSATLGSTFIIPADGTREIASLFVDGKWEPTPYLAFDAGVRYLAYDVDYRGQAPSSYTNHNPPYPPYTGYEGDGLSPSFGITVTPFQGWQVFAKYTEGIRPPSLRESTYTNSALVFNPDIDAEKARNWEVGTNALRNGLLLDGDAARLKLAYFDNTTDGYIGRKATQNGSVLSLFNYDKVEMKGFELSGGYDTGKAFTDFAFNYYTDVILCPTAGHCVDYTLQSDYLANQIPPEFTASVTAGVRFFDGNLTLGGRVNYVGERAARLVPDPTYFFVTTVWAPYTVVDAFAQWKLSDDVTLDISAENLLDRYYMDALNNTSIPSPGRTIRAAFTAKLGSSEPLPQEWPFNLLRSESERDGNWTGLYLGGHMGHGWSEESRSAVSLTGTADATAAGEVQDEDTSGILGGGQIGFNYQLPMRIVLGLEGDFSWLGYQNASQGDATGGTFLAAGQPAARFESTLEWLATLRGRIGYALNDNLMLYGTGGAAFLKQSEERKQFTMPDEYAQQTVPAFTEFDSSTRFGWTLGGGLEYALGGGWSFKGEYLYTSFGAEAFRFPGARTGVTQGRDDLCSPFPDCLFSGGPIFVHVPGEFEAVTGRKVESELDLHALKVGLNYHF